MSITMIDPPITVQRETIPRNSTLLHLSDTCCGPAERTMCGLRILPEATEVPPSTTPDTCAVCLELERSWVCAACR